jgi:hypothetical protein
MERRKLVSALDLGFRLAVLCLIAFGGLVATLVPVY